MYAPTINADGTFKTDSSAYYIRGTGLSALRTQAYVKGSSNIFDTTTVTTGKIITRNSATLSDNPNYFTTDFIPVTDNRVYEANFANTFINCYDSNKHFVGTVDSAYYIGGQPPSRAYNVFFNGAVAYIRGSGLIAYQSDTIFQLSPNASPTFPINASEMVENLCTSYGIPFDANSWQLDDFTIDYGFDYNENTSVRQVLSWIMEIGGGYARINPQGTMECKAFNRHEWTSESTLNGGTINPWESVSAISGGTFSPWSSVTDYDGGSTGGAEFTLSKIKSLNVYIEDITITGIKAIYTEDDEQTFELYGSEGYVLGIDNPMVVADNASEIATRVGDLVNGLSFRPFDASIFGDPSFEAGDVIALKDYLGEEHISLITSLTYSLNQAERLECNAETTMQNSYRW